jgi:DNA replication protein DnaC
MMKTYERVLNQLHTLKLKGVVLKIDEALNEAETRKQSYIGFFHDLLNAELDYRVEKRYQRNMAGAHFPVMKDIDGFEFGKVKGIGKMEVSQLLEFGWLDNHANILFFGPPGLGNYAKLLLM